VKLLLNLVVIANSAIPRGGRLDVRVEGEEPDTHFRLQASGSMARIPANVVDLIAGQPPEGLVDAHVIQPFFTGLVARAAGMAVDLALDGDTVHVTATSSPSA
jgi:histidine phosphotransferase ChpT